MAKQRKTKYLTDENGNPILNSKGKKIRKPEWMLMIEEKKDYFEQLCIPWEPEIETRFAKARETQPQEKWQEILDRIYMSYIIPN